MDRQIVYIGAIPQDTDQLQQNKNTMIGLGYLMQAVLGTGTLVDGLSCTPNSPAAMNVLVGPGSIYSLAEVDATAYGSLSADTTDLIVKQGIITSTQTFSTPAPATSGQSVVYLIQASYQEIDGGSTVLPYYNASNPAVAWSGPNNTGQSQNTVRKGVCTIQIKTGVAASTGSQATPAPDAGFTGLYAITVANGQSTVTSGNIQALTTAPFIGTKLPGILTAIQQDTGNFALDTSTTANTITVTLSPAPASLTNGMPIRVKVANSSTGPTVMNVNGLGSISCTTTSGAAFSSNTVVGNGIYTFVYDANGNRIQLQGFTAASGTGLLPANNLSDVSNAATSLANLGGAPKASPALTGTPTAPTPAQGTNTTQLATCAFVQSVTNSTPQSSFKKLALAWSSNSTVSLTADEIAMENGSGVMAKASGVNLTLNSATSGANGLDTGSLAANTWYFIYVIYNGSAVSCLMSASSTAPTLPSGYTFKTGAIGAVYSDGSNNFVGFLQKGRKVQPLVGSNLSVLPMVCSGVQGNYGTSYTSISVASLVPTAICSLVMFLYSSAAGANYNMAVSPNNNYGHGGVSTTNPPFFGNPYNGVSIASPFEMMLESSSIYVESLVNCALFIQGWELNI